MNEFKKLALILEGFVLFILFCMLLIQLEI